MLTTETGRRNGNGLDAYTSPRAKRQSGFSLIELMIGITVGLIILAGVVALVSKTSFSGLENIRAIQLDQQLRSTMDFIQRDLQRAGYVNAWDPDPADTSPSLLDYLDVDAISLFGEITLGGTCDTGVCDCVLYSYDRNADGKQGIGSTGTPGTEQNNENFELYGFRFNGNAIEMRTSGNAHECDSGTWEDITDESIEVWRDLTVDPKIWGLGFQHDITSTDTIETYVVLDDDGDGTCDTDDTCFGRRKLNIAIDARLESDTAVTLHIRNQVKIKNDRYYTGP